jgi:ubiquinone/menaquinone biosynthesis C-methylase UbiE
MSLQELTWFHPALIDATVREGVEPVHDFMGLSRQASLTAHAVGAGGLIIEGSKHWEYTHALRRAGLLSGVGGRVLDAGCGRSAFTAYLAHRGVRVHGIDLNPSVAARLLPYRVRVSTGDLQALPYRDDSFDQVFCISVLEHTRDPFRCFDELWRVTRAGGTLTVTADYAPWGFPPRTVAAGRVMDHAFLRRLVGPEDTLPDETPTLLEGLGYFSQMWPTILPVYLRFVKDAPAPPHHGSGAPTAGPRCAPLHDPTLRRHVALQCYRAARIYLSYDWIPEARVLFRTAWRLAPQLVSALAWGLVVRLPAPVLRAARRARRAVASETGVRA